MKIDIKIVPYANEVEEKHIEFASKHWNKKRRLDPEYIRWKFRMDEKGIKYSFILAIDIISGKIVGQLGVIPCYVSILDKIHTGQWACDLLVDQEYRGMGIAQKMYDFAHHNCEITLGSNPSPLASISMKNKGYKSIKGSFKFFFAKNLKEILLLKKIKIRFSEYLLNPFLFLLNIIRFFRKSRFKKCTIEDYKKLKTIQLHNLKKSYIVFDDSFIKWRFFPFHKYYLGIDTYKSKSGSFFSGYYVNGIYYINDFSIKTIFEFIDIMNYIISKHNHFKKIFFHSNFIKQTKYFPFLGCIKFRTQTEIIYYSNDKNIKLDNFYYTYHDSDSNI